MIVIRAFIYAAFSLFLGTCCFAQQVPKSTIGYLTIKDSTLIKQIDKMSGSFNVSNTTSGNRRLGYISLYVERYSQLSDTTASYFLSPGLSNLAVTDTDNIYPDFYSLVHDRLVLVYIPILYRSDFATRAFTDKSKKELRKLISKYVEKVKNVQLRGADGKIINLGKPRSISYGGVRIFIMRNKQPEIKMVAEYARFSSKQGLS